MIYGEGKKSFLRLQLAILDQEEDYSILAWSFRGDSGDSVTGLLASSPADFSPKAHLDTRTIPLVPKEWQDEPAASGFFQRWMPQYSSPAVSTAPYYTYLLDTNYDSLQSYVPSKAGSGTGEKLPACLSVKTPRVPVRATSRGLHVSLPVKMSAHSEIPSIAWIYCLYQGRLLCVLLQQTTGSIVFARHLPTFLVTVDAKFLKEFEMNEVYCHASGPISLMGGIVGSLHTFHVALAELGRTEEVAELHRTQKELNDVKKEIGKIQALIGELRHINPSNIIVQSRIYVGWLDKFNIYLEDKTASSWNWGPLDPPRRPCTGTLWHLVLQLISQSSDGHPLVGSAMPSEPADTSPVLYVFLLLEKSSGICRASQITLDRSNSADFFDTLRNEYSKSRGILRNIFSVYRFSHCEFVKAERIHRDAYVVTEQNAFPAVDNYHYQYAPRPMDIMPPVSRHEFGMGFYQRGLSGTRNRHTHDRIQEMLLERLPKRTSPLDESFKPFWGLKARYEILFNGVFFYHAVFLIISIVFGIWWSKEDVQSASVPVTLCMVVVSTFWSF